MSTDDLKLVGIKIWLCIVLLTALTSSLGSSIILQIGSIFRSVNNIDEEYYSPTLFLPQMALD